MWALSEKTAYNQKKTKFKYNFFWTSDTLTRFRHFLKNVWIFTSLPARDFIFLAHARNIETIFELFLNYPQTFKKSFYLCYNLQYILKFQTRDVIQNNVAIFIFDDNFQFPFFSFYTNIQKWNNAIYCLWIMIEKYIGSPYFWMTPWREQNIAILTRLVSMSQDMLKVRS